MIGEGISLAAIRTDAPVAPWTLRGVLYSSLLRSGHREEAEALFAPRRVRSDGRPRDEVRPVVVRAVPEEPGGAEILLIGRAAELADLVARHTPGSPTFLRPERPGRPAAASAPEAFPLGSWMRSLPEGRLAVLLLSPLRIRKAGRFMDRFDPAALADAAAARIRRLRSAFGDGVWEDPDLEAALQEARSCRVAASSLERVRLRRTSTRQAREVWLDGITGWAAIDCAGPAFRRLLAAAEWLHAGKSAAFGCGALRALPAQALQEYHWDGEP
jgi:hypothetical protein